MGETTNPSTLKVLHIQLVRLKGSEYLCKNQFRRQLKAVKIVLTLYKWWVVFSDKQFYKLITYFLQESSNSHRD